MSEKWELYVNREELACVICGFETAHSGICKQSPKFRPDNRHCWVELGDADRVLAYLKAKEEGK